MDGKKNIDKISKLKIKIHDLIKSKAKNFFVNYYQEFKTEEEKALFKQIIYCLNSPSEFDLSFVKEIMDYQLFELEFVNPVFEKRSSERNEIEQTNKLQQQFKEDKELGLKMQLLIDEDIYKALNRNINIVDFIDDEKFKQIIEMDSNY